MVATPTRPTVSDSLWAASRRTSQTTHARPPPPVSGTVNDERGLVHSDGFDRPRVRAHSWRLLRLLQFRDARAQAAAGGAGDRRDAVDQHSGGYPRLYDGAVRDGRGLPRAGRVGRILLGRAGGGVDDRWWRGLPCGCHRGNDRVQRPAQRQARETAPPRRRGGGPLGRLPHEVDRMEPPSDRSRPHHGGLAYHRAPCRVSVQCRIPAHNDSRRNPMSRTPTETMSPEAIRPTALGSAVRALSLAGATLTTGLIAGVFYAYAVSVNLGLAAQPDAAYVATMQAINERIENPLFFASFFGAVLFLLAALVAHFRRPRSGRFWLVALACVLYIGGGFLLTVFVNMPLNEELARVAANASPGELARGRAAYEGPWGFWNGGRTVFSILGFTALVGVCLQREDRGTR